MHALLAKASAEQPVAGNAQGSYLTMRSKNGLIFGVINVIGNFATFFQDQAVSYQYSSIVYLTLTSRSDSIGNVLLQVAQPPA